VNLDDAISAMRYLSAMTTGWNDESAAAYAVELAGTLNDPDALMAACRTIAATWCDSWRPPLGVIRAAYQHELAMRPALPEHVDEDVVSADRGAVVAWEAYVDEVDRLGRVADPGRFGRLLGQSSQSMPSSSATSRR
jgi:hypothetical protein